MPVESGWRQVAAVPGRTKQRIMLVANVCRQMLFDLRNDVRRNRDITDASIRLRCGDLKRVAVGTHSGATNTDHLVGQINVCAAQLDGFAEPPRKARAGAAVSA